MPALQHHPAVSTFDPKYFEDTDIAGICFGPRGKKLYGVGIGAVDEDQALLFGAVAEWTV